MKLFFGIFKYRI